MFTKTSYLVALLSVVVGVSGGVGIVRGEEDLKVDNGQLVIEGESSKSADFQVVAQAVDIGSFGGGDEYRIVPNLSTVCGNNVRENSEDCDGSDLAGKSCQSFGYDYGTLSCNIGCSFEIAGCIRITGGNGGITTTHGECRNQQCVQVAGAGLNRCLRDAECQVVTKPTTEEETKPTNDNNEENKPGVEHPSANSEPVHPSIPEKTSVKVQPNVKTPQQEPLLPLPTTSTSSPSHSAANQPLVQTLDTTPVFNGILNPKTTYTVQIKGKDQLFDQGRITTDQAGAYVYEVQNELAIGQYVWQVFDTQKKNIQKLDFAVIDRFYEFLKITKFAGNTAVTAVPEELVEVGQIKADDLVIEGRGTVGSKIKALFGPDLSFVETTVGADGGFVLGLPTSLSMGAHWVIINQTYPDGVISRNANFQFSYLSGTCSVIYPLWWWLIILLLLIIIGLEIYIIYKNKRCLQRKR